jgi:hypothetical protein
MEAKKYDKKAGNYEELKAYRLLPQPRGELEGLIEGGKENDK